MQGTLPMSAYTKAPLALCSQGFKSAGTNRECFRSIARVRILTKTLVQQDMARNCSYLSKSLLLVSVSLLMLAVGPCTPPRLPKLPTATAQKSHCSALAALALPKAVVSVRLGFKFTKW